MRVRVSWATTAEDNVTVLQMALRHQTATLVLDRNEALLHAGGSRSACCAQWRPVRMRSDPRGWCPR